MDEYLVRLVRCAWSRVQVPLPQELVAQTISHHPAEPQGKGFACWDPSNELEALAVA